MPPPRPAKNSPTTHQRESRSPGVLDHLVRLLRRRANFVDKIGHDFAGKGLHPRTCKIVYMEDTNLAAMYAATVYAIYVVIDRDGYIAGTQRGAGGEEALKRLLARGGLEMPEDSE